MSRSGFVLLGINIALFCKALYTDFGNSCVASSAAAWAGWFWLRPSPRCVLAVDDLIPLRAQTTLLDVVKDVETICGLRVVVAWISGDVYDRTAQRGGGHRVGAQSDRPIPGDDTAALGDGDRPLLRLRHGPCPAKIAAVR